MHELALAQSVVDLVQEHARRDTFTRVRGVRLSIGALSHVDPGALAFGFDVVARGTVVEGAELSIDRPGGTGFCMVCKKNVEITERGEACPSCGRYEWVLVAGDEMRVVELEVD